MTSLELLSWVRGPLFEISLAIFVLGVVYQLLAIIVLGRRADLSLARHGEWGPGLRAILTRNLPERGAFQREPVTVTAGYGFHIGLFAVLFLFEPHIELFREWFGFGWPGLATRVIDIVTGLTIGGLVLVLVYRLANPVRRFLSGFEDYLSWTLTLLPLLTGYFLSHRYFFAYDTMLILHVLSVELLLVLFPFTKLMHAFTLFLARWYNGAIAGRKGVVS